MIKTQNELDLNRESALEAIASYDCRILVCSGTGCIATGSNKIYEIFAELVKETPGVTLEFAPHDAKEHEELVGVKKTGCQGGSQGEPYGGWACTCSLSAIPAR